MKEKMKINVAIIRKGSKLMEKTVKTYVNEEGKVVNIVSLREIFSDDGNR